MPEEVAAEKVARWEVQHSAAYGKPHEMLFYADSEEKCRDWWAVYGVQYPNGDTRIVQA